MRQILLSFLLFFYAVVLCAEDANIIIKQKSGNETRVQLSTHPIITFEGENMVITNDYSRIIFPLGDIDDYIVSDGTAGILPITTKPQFLKGNIVFSRLPKGSLVNVYSMNGKCVSTQIVDGSNMTIINLETLPKGTYVVCASDTRIKVINK